MNPECERVEPLLSAYIDGELTESDRRRVEAIIHQPLDDVHGVDILGYPSAGEDALVLAQSVVWKVVVLLEPLPDVVGVYDGILRYSLDPLRAQ